MGIHNNILLKLSKYEIFQRIPPIFARKVLFLILLTTILVLLISSISKIGNIYYDYKLFFNQEKIDFSNADNESGFDHYIIPNIVHFIHFDEYEMSFVEMICIRSAYLHQNPDKIMIHSNLKQITGKYWQMVQDIPILQFKYMKKPTHIFGKQLSQVFHASDVARMLLLMKYGGIYLDSDTYVVQSLDQFRKFEMTVGWPIEEAFGTQVLIAHKNARFLRLHRESYHKYNGSLWYYNAGELPTKEILEKKPNLVHRVPVKFGVETPGLCDLLYNENSYKWKTFYTIHLLIGHRDYLVPDDYKIINDYDEVNIKVYNKTFGKMARLVLYGTEEYVT